ncbi:hypothetical protein CDL15_Pgr023882 [Punica granatum]|uniref:EF-hand domain-containing protein n=1 Tax=Punica granatum TaxID=22663 RepID=A0A218XWK4_PUNGR|nr:hypothetical protein CDL15_Pgr023882 [Punica granatum]
MLSRAWIKRCFRFLDQIPEHKNARIRTFFKKCQSHDGSWSCNNSGHKERGSRLGSRAGLVSSRILIVGSSVGLCYFSVNAYSPESNRIFSSTECEGESHASGDDLLRDMKNEKKKKFLFGDAYRRKVFFNYEKRIRMQSSPEKVFEYFASIERPSGEVLMTPADLMRAIVPVFPPSESDWVREGSLKGERTTPGRLYCRSSEFFMLFDTNGDGYISFPEYIFFITLLSIPETSFSIAFKMFDTDNSGEIDKDEFKKVMNLMRSQNRYGTNHRDGKRKMGKATESVDDGGLLEYFFGKDGTKKLQHERFVQFLRDLHDEILRLEFAHYDCRSRGTIPAKDYALSLVASADISHTNKLLDRVEEIDNDPSLRDVRITFDEFKDFSDLRKKLQSFSLALFSYGKLNGLLTKKDFQRAASQVCGIKLTDNVVDVIFHVFNTDRDEHLSSKEFVRVIERRTSLEAPPREAGIKGLVSCWTSCAARCKSSKLLL